MADGFAWSCRPFLVRAAPSHDPSHGAKEAQQTSEPFTVSSGDIHDMAAMHRPQDGTVLGNPPAGAATRQGDTPLSRSAGSTTRTRGLRTHGRRLSGGGVEDERASRRHR